MTTETKKVETTRLPWVVLRGADDKGVSAPYIYGDDDVCDLYRIDHGGFIRPFANAEANAAFIVRCVNSHQALVDAAKAALTTLAECRSNLWNEMHTQDAAAFSDAVMPIDLATDQLTTALAAAGESA